MSELDKILLVTLGIAIFFSIILFIMNEAKKKKLANMEPYEIGLVVDDEIFVPFDAQLIREDRSKTTVFLSFQNFFPNPEEELNRFYEGHAFGISLPIARVERGKIYVEDVNHNQYLIVMETLPKQVTMSVKPFKTNSKN